MNKFSDKKHGGNNTSPEGPEYAGTRSDQLPHATLVRDFPLAVAVDTEEMLGEWMYSTAHLPEALVCSEEAGLFENLMPAELQDLPVLLLRLPSPLQLRLGELAITDMEFEDEKSVEVATSTVCVTLRVCGVCVSFPPDVFMNMPLDDGSDDCIFALMLIAGGRVVIAERRIPKCELLEELDAVEMFSGFNFRTFRSEDGREIGAACEEAWLDRETITIRLAVGKAEEACDERCEGQRVIH